TPRRPRALVGSSDARPDGTRMGGGQTHGARVTGSAGDSRPALASGFRLQATGERGFAVPPRDRAASVLDWPAVSRAPACSASGWPEVRSLEPGAWSLEKFTN